MSSKSTIEMATRLAAEALKQYSEWRLARFIDIRENAIFEIESHDGRRAALRVHRSGYQSEQAIGSELELMAFLSSSGMRVPMPVSNDQGSPVTRTSSGATVSALSWLPGISLSDLLCHRHHETGELESVYRRLGKQLARLHNLSDSFSPSSDFARWHWDSAGFTGEAPHWGRFWDHPSLTTSQRRFMNELRHAVRRRLESWASMGLDFGLIHADALPENVIVNGDNVHLIDFDDSGHGFRMYELAVAVWGTQTSTDPPALSDAMHFGYCSERPLPDWQWQTLETFVVVRNLACLGWIVARAEIGDTVERFVRHTKWLESEGARWLDSNS